MITVRSLTAADAESAARCHTACWAEAYAGIVPAASLAHAVSSLDQRSERWRSFVDHDPPRLVAVDADGEVVGFVASGASRDDDLALLELHAIYVRAAYWGSGLGQRLLDAAVGDRPAFLWVLRDNPRARAFYARNGFRPDGVEKYDDFFDAAEIRMVRPAGVPVSRP